MTSLKSIGIVLLLVVLAAPSAHAQSRKRGRKGKSTSTDLSSGLTLVPSPSSLMAPTPAPAASTPPPTDWKPQPAPPEPATAAPAESPPEADADRPRISLLPLVALGVEPLWEGRVFRQTDFAPTQYQRRYNAIGYPSVGLTAEFFPFANVKSKFLRGIGLTGHFARAFGFESANPTLGSVADTAAAPVDAFYMRYTAGLRYRIHANPESETPLVLAVSASLCRWYYYFGSEVPSAWDVEVPTANYRMARIGFDAGLEVKRVTFYGYLNYLHAYSVIAPSSRELDVSDPYFFGAAGMGGELRGAVGVRVLRWLQLRVSLEYAIMAFKLKPLEGQPNAATVLDSYLSAGLGPYVSF